MKDNSNKDISIGFIIEPVHQNNKRENTNNEVQTIKPSLTHYVSMIITFDTCKGKMPYSPVGCKQHGCIKKGSYESGDNQYHNHAMQVLQV